MTNEIFCVCGCRENYSTPPLLYEKAKNYFETTWQLPLGYAQGHLTGWRSRSKLAVRAPGDIGLFARGSHTVVNIPHCKAHHPQINEAVKKLKALNFTSYNEATGVGDLRYIQCVVERASGRVQLALVLNMEKSNAFWQKLINELYEPTFWHSIWCNYNTCRTNTIFGKHWEKVVGDDVVWEEIAGNKIAFGPSHFGQANLEMYEKLILDLQKEILPESTLSELYAGIGTIGLSMASICKEVRLVEVEPHAQSYFIMAKEQLAQPLQEKLIYQTEKAENALTLVEGATSCIVDPPRKGLGEALLHKLLAIKGLKQLAYISCDYTSLERDLAVLPPNWRPTFAKSYLFFPGTNQIETLVIITHASR